ncbi:MAG TPA: ABC transporter substrate-binding protein [Sphingomonadales bacterium]|nr:ABC transporter substrate-binding protein [Sphingomonadales bacterium]
MIALYGRFWAAAKAMALALALGMVAAPASASQASDVITAFHEKLLTAMRNASAWDYRERYDYLMPAVEATFNTPAMMKLASSSYWRKFSDEEREELSTAFTEFTVANYASRFNGYSGQAFVTAEEKEMKNGRVLVKTRLERGKSAPISIDYMMSPNPDGTFEVIDVFLDGKYSELSLRRSEFSPTLRNQGFTGLLALLKNKVNSLEADAAR